MKKHLAWERRRPAGPAGRRPASSFALRARPAGRRRSQGRTPLPTSPLKGEEQESRGVGRLTDVAVDGQERAPPPSSLLPPGRGEVGRGVDPGDRRPGRGPSRSRSSVNCLGAPASRRLGGPKARSSFALRARPAGRRRSQGRTPLPTSPLKGGRREEKGRSADGAARTLRHHRRWTNGRIAAVSLLPPGRGEVGRGVDPGAGPPGRGPSRSRSSVNRLGAPASRRLGGPKARILVRASREAVGTPAFPGAGPPSRPPP